MNLVFRKGGASRSIEVATMFRKSTYRLPFLAVCFLSTVMLFKMQHTITCTQRLHAFQLKGNDTGKEVLKVKGNGTGKEVFKLKDTDNSKKPLIVLGIFTIDGHSDFRNAQRKTWLSSMMRLQENIPFSFVYKFWFDGPTQESTEENKVYGDIDYLNVTNHDFDVSFGEHMYVWMKYVIAFYPEAMLTFKVDDDVFLCVPQVFHKLDRIKSRKLYYGSVKSGGEVDEMVVVTGIELVKRIARREYCSDSYTECDTKSQLIENGARGNSLGAWLDIYDDVNLYAGNAQIIHQSRLFKGNTNPVFKKDFCGKFVSHHKSTPENMNTLHGFNSMTHRH